MPLWDIQTTPSLLSLTEKQDLVKAITHIYLEAGLPPFYVNIRFTEHQNTLFNGGKEASNVAVIRIEHLARQFDGKKQKDGFRYRIDQILNPVFKPKGTLWEYGITELDRELWEINGLVPPMPKTEMERKWVELNWPVEDAKM